MGGQSSLFFPCRPARTAEVKHCASAGQAFRLRPSVASVILKRLLSFYKYHKKKQGKKWRASSHLFINSVVQSGPRPWCCGRTVCDPRCLAAESHGTPGGSPAIPAHLRAPGLSRSRAEPLRTAGLWIKRSGRPRPLCEGLRWAMGRRHGQTRWRGTGETQLGWPQADRGQQRRLV